MLNEKFPLTTININKGKFSAIIKSFVVGCLFALPIAISNLSDVISTNPYQWITQYWQTILAFNMVILEEIWLRLFVLIFVYALISSKTNERYIPIIIAILISSTLFGFTHYPHIDIQNCFNIMILYGFPLGVLLYKRDFETVVGYHFMVSFMGAIASYLINKG